MKRTRRRKNCSDNARVEQSKVLKNFSGVVRRMSDGRVEIVGLGKKPNPGDGSRFKKCVEEVAAKGGAYDPRAVCAAEGRKKYGAKKFAAMARAGKRRKARNVAAGFMDEDGIFHPIRASYDYSGKRAGEGGRSKAKSKKKKGGKRK